MNVWNVALWSPWDWAWMGFVIGYGVLVAVASRTRAPWWFIGLLILLAAAAFNMYAWC